ncbi:MAG: zinc-dependent alcohol dehydrogenase [Gammaproteobacteria bacterium]
MAAFWRNDWRDKKREKNKMKALMLTGTRQLALTNAPQPQDKSGGDIVVRIAAVGICGSDMHAYLGHDERRPPPLILGHESAGETASGKKVIINPLVVCGSCDYCRAGRDNLCVNRQLMSMPPRPGSFAEYASAPERNLIPLPEGLTMEQGALAEPLACGHHTAALAVHHLQKDAADSRVMIIGGGAIGVASALSLMARGMGEVRIVETNTARRAALADLFPGRLITTLPPETIPAPQDKMAEVIIDAVGNESSRILASAYVAPGGAVVHIGLASGEGGFDIRRLTLQEILLSGSYTYTAAEFAETVQWMAAGKLGALNWYQTRPLADGAKVFASLQKSEIPTPKTLLLP